MSESLLGHGGSKMPDFKGKYRSTEERHTMGIFAADFQGRCSLHQRLGRQIHLDRQYSKPNDLQIRVVETRTEQRIVYFSR